MYAVRPLSIFFARKIPRLAESVPKNPKSLKRNSCDEILNAVEESQLFTKMPVELAKKKPKRNIEYSQINSVTKFPKL